MKTFLKRLAISAIIIILILGGIIGYFYIQARPQIDESTNTQIAISRTMKASLRNTINQTTNASLTQILQATYNGLHTYNNNKIQKSKKTTREHTIEHTGSIIDIAIRIPHAIATQIQVSNEKESTITFNYKEQFLGSITIYDEEERSQLEETGLNQEKIAEEEGYVLVYTQTLDNPFEGIELETFGEVVFAFNQAIETTEIKHITHIDTILGYITKITEEEESINIYTNPVTLFTGEQAANIIAENDPELCESILSGTDQTLCIPEDNIYILDEDEEDVIQIALIANEGLQTIIETIGETTNQLVPIDIQTFISDREDNYQETLFSIQFIDSGALLIQENYIP